MKCRARQYGDQKVCAACGLVWDMNDPDPPQCKPTREHVEKERADRDRFGPFNPDGSLSYEFADDDRPF